MQIVKKLTSRKFWMAAAGVATGVALALGADSTEIQTISGAIMALASAITYIIAEGRVDAASVQAATAATQTAVETIKGEGNA